MFHGIGILLILTHFIVIVILLTLLWRISFCLDLISRTLNDMSKDMKRLADKDGK